MFLVVPLRCVNLVWKLGCHGALFEDWGCRGSWFETGGVMGLGLKLEVSYDYESWFENWGCRES